MKNFFIYLIIVLIFSQQLAQSQEIKDKRADIIAKSNVFEDEINVLTTVEDVMRYSHAFYPQPTLEELNVLSANSPGYNSTVPILID